MRRRGVAGARLQAERRRKALQLQTQARRWKGDRRSDEATERAAERREATSISGLAATHQEAVRCWDWAEGDRTVAAEEGEDEVECDGGGDVGGDDGEEEGPRGAPGFMRWEIWSSQTWQML
ncbi:uncharacterized protein LOC126796467 [Argentina anserina]|uniref:uncharacterized protein LOC126796467 n=1 Tax=Argentina anserina TaxID=57926 RepID=UPI0021764D04|nr:uncharacterized protein LOC126796467 [Potentilla anserina]